MQLKSCRLAFCCFLNSLNFIPEFSSLCAVLAECRERSTEQWSDSCKNLALCKGKKFTACFSSTSGQRQRQSDPPKRSSQFTWRPALSCAPRIVCEGTATGQALSSVPFVPSPCQMPFSSSSPPCPTKCSDRTTGQFYSCTQVKFSISPFHRWWRCPSVRDERPSVLSVQTKRYVRADRAHPC